MVKKVTGRKRIILPILIIVFVLILICCGLFLWYTFSGNYITYANIDGASQEVTLTDAANSKGIIVNGIVIGAAKNGKWISADKFYEANSKKDSLEVNLFSENKMYGTYDTASLKKYNKSVIYTTIAKEGLPLKYLAIESSNEDKIMPGMTKLDATDEDTKYVKEALGSYKLINGSVNVTEVYLTNINQASDKIICAVSKKANWLGVYSVIVYVTEGKANLVKYAYVRDTDNSSRWPVYSLQFVKDLNEDNKPELIIEEITGDDVSYIVLEKRGNIFYQVLKSIVEI